MAYRRAKGINTATPDAIAAMSPDMLLDYLGIRLNGPKADGKHTVINWNLGDGRTYGIELRNSVLIYTEGVTLANPDATLTMSKNDFTRLLMGGAQAPLDADKISRSASCSPCSTPSTRCSTSLRRD